MKKMQKDRYDYNDLKEIIKTLRSENGCPWDRVQTHESLKPHLVEEAYEVLDAIERNNPDMLKDELGDYLLQVVLHAEIADEAGRFSLDDVVDIVSKKMIFRHSFVFGEDSAASPDDALAGWEKNKKKASGDQTLEDTLLGISKSFPSLIRAEKLHKKIKSYVSADMNSIDFLDEIREKILMLKEGISSEEYCAGLTDILMMLTFEAFKKRMNLEIMLGDAINQMTQRMIRLEKDAQKNEDNLYIIDKDTLKKLYKT